MASVLWAGSRMKVPQNRVQLPQKACLSEQVKLHLCLTLPSLGGYLLRTWKLLLLPPLSIEAKPTIPTKHFIISISWPGWPPPQPAFPKDPPDFSFDPHDNTTQSCSHIYTCPPKWSSWTLGLMPPAFKVNTKKGNWKRVLKAEPHECYWRGPWKCC